MIRDQVVPNPKSSLPVLKRMEMMEKTPKALKILTWFTAVLFLIALYLALVYAPREAVMGDVQRVFYFHVAAGWVGALAFLVTTIVGIFYLVTRDLKWDHIALSSVEVGVVFTFINIVTGSIWARPLLLEKGQLSV